MARRPLTSISIMGTPNSHVGTPRNNGGFMSARSLIFTEAIGLHTGVALPYTHHSDPIAAGYFEDILYRVYNPYSGKDADFVVNTTLEWSTSVIPTGQDLEGVDEVDNATWNATWIANADELLGGSLDGGINNFYIKDQTINAGFYSSGPGLIRVAATFTTGCDLSLGGLTYIVEFWANSHSVNAQSNVYVGNNGSMDIHSNSRKTNLLSDRHM